MGIYNQDPTVKAAASQWTEALEKAKDLTQHHDIGFVMYCSYGNALRLEKDSAKIKAYEAILLHSAESAMKRYDPRVGVIKSWNEKASWDGKTVWKYPVIIDNMMNLELLFFASMKTGDPKYRNAAISHATKTMKNHFRDDYSTPIMWWTTTRLRAKFYINRPIKAMPIIRLGRGDRVGPSMDLH